LQVQIGENPTNLKVQRIFIKVSRAKFMGAYVLHVLGSSSTILDSQSQPYYKSSPQIKNIKHEISIKFTRNKVNTCKKYLT